MAKLYFRYGAMNCGKSTSLLQVAHNYEEKGMNVCIVKPSTDTKGDASIVSRLGVKREVDLVLYKEDSLLEKIHSLKNLIDCVLIDEAQFLTKEQVRECLAITTSMDIPVICYGLRTDFQLEGFEGSSELLLLAHKLEEMKTVCDCGKKAIVNLRKLDGKPCFEGEQVLIDGSNDRVQYDSICYNCFFDLKTRG